MQATPLIPQRKGVEPLGIMVNPRILAADYQKLYGSNNKWKKRYGCHKPSLSEIAIYQVKTLFGGR